MLPGTGRGMIDESITDTTNSPRVPKPMSQCKPCADGQLLAAFDPCRAASCFADSLNHCAIGRIKQALATQSRLDISLKMVKAVALAAGRRTRPHSR